MKLINPEYLEYTSTGLEYINPDYWKMIEEEFEKMTKRKAFAIHNSLEPIALTGTNFYGEFATFDVLNLSIDRSMDGNSIYTFECIKNCGNEFLFKYHYDKHIPYPTQVIFNPPATIVYWSDGTKTVVKCVDEKFDEEKGLAMAISKKALGNKGNYYNYIKKFLTEEDNE